MADVTTSKNVLQTVAEFKDGDNRTITVYATETDNYKSATATFTITA